MADLVIVIPFTADPNCDLDQSAAEMQNFFNSIQNHVLGQNVGAQIDSINIVYEPDAYQCAAGDYVILFAHGGQDDTDLSNNQGQTITMDDAIAKLDAINADQVARVLFMCCFSGLAGHIGATWKAAHPAQQTYGGNSAISNLYAATRTQIRAVCLALYAL